MHGISVLCNGSAGNVNVHFLQFFRQNPVTVWIFLILILYNAFQTFLYILGSISKTPYLTKRIPDTHRGRVLSITNSFAGLIGVLSNYVIGTLIDYYPFRTV